MLQKVNIIWQSPSQIISRALYRKGRNLLLERLQPHAIVCNGTIKRTLHTSASVMLSKILTLEEIFARTSLQNFLKKVETDYNDCLNAVNTSEIEEYPREEELRAKRTKVARLTPVIQSIRDLNAKEKEMAETEILLKDEDTALRELAELEREACLQDIQEFRQKILDLLIPEEDPDLSDLVLEVTAGVGGQEAMLFTAEVFDMYQGFAQHHGWSFDILEYMSSDIGWWEWGKFSFE